MLFRNMAEELTIVAFPPNKSFVFDDFVAKMETEILNICHICSVNFSLIKLVRKSAFQFVENL